MNEIFNNEDWVIRKWRPIMAWVYMVICAFDFVIGPVLFTVLQHSAQTIIQWEPMTMRAGGLFHVAMGTIIGITAWSRGQEKMRFIEYFVPEMKDRINAENNDPQPIPQTPIVASTVNDPRV